MENWSGTFTFGAARVHRPNSVEEVQDIVASATKVKATGTRHSFQPIADTEGDLISTENLNRILSLDSFKRRVTVEPGVTYGELGAFLHQAGFALPNYASLPHISIAGACATATHGSGNSRGSLATSIASQDMVMADGQIATFSGNDLHAAAVHLGALGVVTSLTLSVVVAFEVSQVVYEQLSFETAFEHFDAIMAAGYSVSLFTDWKKPCFNQIWVKRKAGETPFAPDFFGAKPAIADVHPIPGLPAKNCTPQMGIPGPSHERLPHFRLDFTPSAGEEIQSEYLVPRERAVEALRAIHRLAGVLSPHVLTSEIRSIAADPHWMSPFFERPSLGIHMTWRKDPLSVSHAVRHIEGALAPFQARPHWGKCSSIVSDQARALYPRYPDFIKFAGEVDPEGKFQNPWLDRVVFGKGGKG